MVEREQIYQRCRDVREVERARKFFYSHVFILSDLVNKTLGHSRDILFLFQRRDPEEKIAQKKKKKLRKKRKVKPQKPEKPENPIHVVISRKK